MNKQEELNKLKEVTFNLIDEMKGQLSERRISIDAGVSPTTLFNWRNGITTPTYTSLKKIYDYLSIFKANMQRIEGGFSETSLSSAIKETISTEYSLIPMVTIRAKTGYSTDYSNNIYLDSLPKIPVRIDREYKGKYLIFEIEGDSMNDGSADSLFSGDNVLCKNIGKEHWRYPLPIRDWFFIIVHKTEGIIAKEIVKHDTDRNIITCHSLNNLYGEDFEIHLRDVVELYSITELIKRPLRK